MGTLADLQERRRLREARRAAVTPAAVRERLLEEQIAFLDRYSGLLKILKEPLMEALERMAALQVQEDGEPDYQLALAALLRDGRHLATRLQARAEEQQQRVRRELGQ